MSENKRKQAEAKYYNAYPAKFLRDITEDSNQYTKVAIATMLSKNLGHTVKPQTVSAWCRGITLPNSEHIIALSKVLDVSCDILLGTKMNTMSDSEKDAITTDYTGLTINAIKNLRVITGKLITDPNFKPSPKITNLLVECGYLLSLVSHAANYYKISNEILREKCENEASNEHDSGNESPYAKYGFYGTEGELMDFSKFSMTKAVEGIVSIIENKVKDELGWEGI
jgi:hypothetical protein